MVVLEAATQKNLLLTLCTVKNVLLHYTLIGVVEEVLFQHPCLAPIFSRKIVVRCMLIEWSNG